MPIDWPTGGQSNDCAVFSSQAPYQFRIDNPQTLASGYTTTAPDGTTVNFKLTIATNGLKKDKFFDWTATGANVFDVGVKGGADTARYAYTTPIPNWSTQVNKLAAVYADTSVHATLDNQGKLYSLSNVAFCYSTTPAIEGTVFDDSNGNGTKDTGEGGLSGRTVRLYSGAATTTATTATTGSNGKYVFSATQVTVNSGYRVCLVAAAAERRRCPRRGRSAIRRRRRTSDRSATAARTSTRPCRASTSARPHP